MKARQGARGVLPSQALRALVASGGISSSEPIAEEQIQPASLDLRLGDFAWRMQASVLPGPRATVKERAAPYVLYQLDLTQGAVLERNCVYLIPLLEQLHLPPGLAGLANPKSSTGRLDVFARIVTDAGPAFDAVRAGYSGPLYAEICPRTFPIRVRTGTRLTQLRLREGEVLPPPPFSSTPQSTEATLGSVAFSVDLQGDGEELVGWKAKPNAGLIDIESRETLDPLDYWDPVIRSARGIVLNPNDFYILMSRESVSVPADCAAEMLAYDTQIGEFRVHYAGFFDPGFGDPSLGGQGSRAVLEVRAHDVPFVIEDGQVVGRLVYEPLTELPDKLYGQGIGSNYQQQSLRLSKQFRPRVS